MYQGGNHLEQRTASVNMLASSEVDRGFEPRSGQIKDYEIGICCFSAKNAALRRESKDRSVRTRVNVSKWGNMYIRTLLFSKLAL